jgi:hypothetical protein
MRKLTIGIAGTAALMLAGFLTWNAEATPLTGVTAVPSGMNHSLVEKAACWLPGLPGDCEIGQQRVCSPRGHRCRCAPCPGWYPWREYKPAH